MSRPAPLLRGAVIALIAVTAALGVAGTASAHVTVHSGDDPTRGGYAELTFRVPTERDDASTTRIAVTLPSATPIASISVKPHPGWTATVTKTKPATALRSDDGPITEVVSAITWTADSAATAVKPGQFDEFSVSGGPMPNVTELRFPTVQTYSDGETVKWNENAAAGAPEPDHPAPSIEVEAASAASSSAAPTAVKTEDQGSNMPALVLAIIALVVALGAAAAGGLALRVRRPRR